MLFFVVSTDLTYLSVSDLDQLIASVPHFNQEFVAAVYELSKMNFATSFNCLHDYGGTLQAVLELMKQSLGFDDTGNVPKIYVNNNVEDYVEAALQFYKSPSLDCKKGVCIDMVAAPGIDVGGIRRDFYSSVYQKLSSGYLNFFEGSHSHIRPACNMSSLSSGILKNIGTMIGHSTIMNSIGFPLSSVMYYYMCGDINTAIMNLDINDACEKASYYVKEIHIKCILNYSEIFTLLSFWVEFEHCLTKKSLN